MYDAIVIGARCGGAPLAMLLARRGHRVLVLDKANFPHDTLSTHQIQLPGVAKLATWGLLERVRATGAPPVREVHFDQGGGLVLDGTFPELQGVRDIFSVRRTVLDAILIDAAREAGAEVREGTNVDELVLEDGRVVGIRAGGQIERANVVVGADGKHSLVATAMQAATYRAKPTLSCAYYAYFTGVPSTRLEIYGRGRRAMGMMPTNDGAVCVFTAWPHDEFSAYRADIEGNFLTTVDLVPELGERIRSATRVERFYGTADLPNVFRRPFGPGWALVGDAGYVLDPLTGQGIADAFRDAELLAEALHAVLASGRPFDKALGEYEKKRNAAAMPMYELTTDLASFVPPAPEKAAVLMALVGNQAQTDRFLGVLTGSVPIAEFFSPLNLMRLVGPLGFARLAMGRAA